MTLDWEIYGDLEPERVTFGISRRFNSRWQLGGGPKIVDPGPNFDGFHPLGLANVQLGKVRRILNRRLNDQITSTHVLQELHFGSSGSGSLF